MKKIALLIIYSAAIPASFATVEAMSLIFPEIPDRGPLLTLGFE